MPSRDYCVGLISGVVNPDPSEKNPPREQPVPEQAPPIPRAVLVPELEQPLISDHERHTSYMIDDSNALRFHSDTVNSIFVRELLVSDLHRS